MRKIFHFIFSACFLLPTNAPVLADETGSAGKPASDKYVLAVGIDDYTDPLVSDLGGCENDIKTFKKLVTDEPFWFSADQVLLLPTKSATKEAIKSAFKSHLIANAKRNKDGTFVFYYSGHGTQVPDQAPFDEGDRMDEAICPVDTKKGRIDSLLRDDEINDLVKELAAHAKNVTCIFDCCCSGTNTRDPQSLPPEVKVRFYNFVDGSSEPGNVSTAGGAAVLDPAKDDYLAQPSSGFVTISGCMPDELSNETVFDGQRNGALTKYLVDTLKANKGRMSYRDLSNELFKLVSAKFSRQHPQIEGDSDRQIFTISKDKISPYFQVKNVANDVVTIDAGEAMGLMDGGVVAFYDKSEMELRGSKGLLATGEVTSITPFTAQVKLENSVSDSNALKLAKAVIVAPDAGKSQLSVAIATKSPKPEFADQHKKFVAALQEKLKLSECAKKVELIDNPIKNSRKGWDTAVVLDTYKNFVAGEKRLAGTKACDGINTTCADDDLVYYLASEDGVPLYEFFVPASDADAFDHVASALKIRSHERHVFALQNKAAKGDMKIEVSLVRVREKVNPDGPTIKVEENITPTPGKKLPEFTSGENVKIKVKNVSDKDVYLGALCVGTSGAVDVLYPSPKGKTLLLKANTEIPVLDTEVSGPRGIDTFKFILSSQPIDLTHFGQEGVRPPEGGVRSVPSAPNPADALEGIFLKSSGVITRDFKTKQPLPVEGWDVVTMNVRQVAPEQTESKESIGKNF